MYYIYFLYVVLHYSQGFGSGSSLSGQTESGSRDFLDRSRIRIQVKNLIWIPDPDPVYTSFSSILLFFSIRIFFLLYFFRSSVIIFKFLPSKQLLELAKTPDPTGSRSATLIIAATVYSFFLLLISGIFRSFRS